MQISLTLFYQYLAIFFNFSSTSSHFYPLQVENCSSNSRLVVSEDDNGKFRPEKVKHGVCKKCHYMGINTVPVSIYNAKDKLISEK